ncbi:helix-turn-helix domain-containing protein [Halobacillus ihumii]|uniref:helix-turn-helix domain-containing protein n=1 Tax=Halobacillus ihumii TaxID=2686092 RepID=UPI0013D275A6|nr:helix-turn-helix domain-containing protein [Halobacillus ihumii]
MESEKRLMSLIHSVRVLNSTRDLSEVLHQLIKEVHNVIGGANASVLFLYDKQSGFLYAKSAIGFDMEFMKHARLRPGEGMSGRTFLLKKGNIFYSEEDTAYGMSNIPKETENYYARALGKMEYPESAICVPLLSNNECIGVLTVDIYEKGIQFDEADLQLLETFAGQAAIAIENATLFSQNERTKRIHEELSKVSLSKGGLSDITRSLAGLIDHQVLVFNQFMESLAVSSQGVEHLAHDLKDKFSSLLEASLTKSGFSSHRVTLFQQGHFIYFFPIKTERMTLGLLTIIIKDYSELDPLDKIAIEQAIPIFAMEIDRQERLLAEDFNNSGTILEQLIHAPYDELSSNHLAKLNFPEHDSHHYVIVHLFIKNPLLAFEKISSKKQQLMRIIYREVSNLSYKTLVYDKNMEITLMFTVSSSLDEERIFQRLEKLFSKIIKTSSEKLDLANLAGFGQVVKKLKNVHLSYTDAKRCVQYLQTAYKGESLLTYKQLGPYRLFLKFDRKELKEYAEAILGVIINYDHNHGTELLKTLQVYLESNQNMEKSSKQLFVHVNTVKYRLKTIYKILRVEELSGREAFELQLGLRILEYLDMKA